MKVIPAAHFAYQNRSFLQRVAVGEEETRIVSFPDSFPAALLQPNHKFYDFQVQKRNEAKNICDIFFSLTAKN